MLNNLAGFSPDSFEQFIRALSIHVFGPGVTVFGNGPDGGREATFDGTVSYPHPPSSQWKGYGVIQAKCKEKLETTTKDQSWAIANLRAELKKFIEAEDNRRKPEYFVFATNVELSSMTKRGKDQCASVIESVKNKLPLKGYAIWDANQLISFVDAYPEIRNRFRHFLTSGDLISILIDGLMDKNQEIRRILIAHIERELRADANARLDQTGDHSDQSMQLAHLFFDLPASSKPLLEPPDDTVDKNGNFINSGVFRELLNAGSRKLDSITLSERQINIAAGGGELFPTRFLLLGGPGSGKSTLSQFLAQIHRALLLDRIPQNTLSSDAKNIKKTILNVCERERLSIPLTPRFPIRVDLNRFSKALTTGSATTLSDYVRSHIQGSGTIEHRDLISIIQRYPVVLILDGLDEVPITSNRKEVVKEIDDFLAEARLAEADIFVVATSRQQGYSGEFQSEETNLRHILPLSTRRALRYVERFTEVRYGQSDPVKKEDIIQRLKECVNREMTAQLMVSPLQVTFMITVVAHQGDPGDNRWQLFGNYYQTIYNREMQKAVRPYDAILNKQKALIDRLHHDIGFWLQYCGEAACSSSISLGINVFEHLVNNYLESGGHNLETRADLVKTIVEAARNRLVFLTSRVENELSFDVRSLQEYMAAESVMTGHQDKVIERLGAIAPAAYWRNVFLIAVNKCFSDAQSRHLMDSIVTICARLNDPVDPLLSTIRAGSDLALEILQSGVVEQNPRSARLLADNSLQLLAWPEWRVIGDGSARLLFRFGKVFQDDLQESYRRNLVIWIGQADQQKSLGAWAVLTHLADKDVGWARELADRNWPNGSKEQFAIVDGLTRYQVWGTWLSGKLKNLLPMLSMSDFNRIDNWLDVFKNRYQDFGIMVPLKLSSGMRGITLQFGAVGEDGKLLDYLSKVMEIGWQDPSWSLIRAGQQFLKEPNAESLAQAIEYCAKSDWKGVEESISTYIPWPLANCLKMIESKGDFADIISKVRSGRFGDLNDWVQAEKRWRVDGVTEKDLSEPVPTLLLCFPQCVRCSITVGGFQVSNMGALLRACQRLEAGSLRNSILWLIKAIMPMSPESYNAVDPTELRALLEVNPSATYFGLIPPIREIKSFISDWMELCEWGGRSCNLYYGDLGHDFFERFEALQVEFVRKCGFEKERVARHNGAPDMPLGLLRIIAHGAAYGMSPTQVPRNLLRSFDYAAGKFSFSSCLLQLTYPDLTPDEASELADTIAQLLNSSVESNAQELLFTLVQNHMPNVPAIEEFLLRLREKMPTNVVLGIPKCDALLRQFALRRSSGFQGKLREFDLPEIR